MPKREEIAPWRATAASLNEPYPRKNLYFVGEGQEDVYDYLIWRANVQNYITLDGLVARSSSEMMNDVLKRAYLRDMLDQKTANEFRDWLASHQGKTEHPEPIDKRQISGLGRTSPEAQHHAGADYFVTQPRLVRFLRAHSAVDRPSRLAIWTAQSGKCFSCGRERPLRLIESSRLAAVSRGATCLGLSPDHVPAHKTRFVAVCLRCFRTSNRDDRP